MRQSDGRESEIISEAMAALARRSNAAQRKRLGKRYSAEMSRRARLGGLATAGKARKRRPKQT